MARSRGSCSRTSSSSARSTPSCSCRSTSSGSGRRGGHRARAGPLQRGRHRLPAGGGRPHRLPRPPLLHAARRPAARRVLRALRAGQPAAPAGRARASCRAWPSPPSSSSNYIHVVDMVPVERRGWALGIFGLSGLVSTSLAPLFGELDDPPLRLSHVLPGLHPDRGGGHRDVLARAGRAAGRAGRPAGPARHPRRAARAAAHAHGDRAVLRARHRDDLHVPADLRRGPRHRERRPLLHRVRGGRDAGAAGGRQPDRRARAARGDHPVHVRAVRRDLHHRARRAPLLVRRCGCRCSHSCSPRPASSRAPRARLPLPRDVRLSWTWRTRGAGAAGGGLDAVILLGNTTGRCSSATWRTAWVRAHVEGADGAARGGRDGEPGAAGATRARPRGGAARG